MPDQEHKRYIDGKLHEVRECPECDGWGEREYADPEDPSGTIGERCDTCEGEGYIKK